MKFVMLTSVVIFTVFGLCRSEDAEEKYPRVITPMGIIEGVYNTSSKGKRYESYLGIPYADPITKERRFEIAEPVTPWTGVLSAKSFGPACMQVELLSAISNNPSVSGSEDCLYLNVYTPSTKCKNGTESSNDSLPVIIYIHGGGFQWGSAAELGPDYLLNEQVILVTITYRLGALGFLSTEDDTVPGNMGLKDQVIAMRWVKDNILYFGGDPERITLVGQSAGGVSVHYHYLTNLTRGLFQRGMSISGNALDCWAQTEASLQKARRLATIIGCPSSDIEAMVNCLKNQPAENITLASLQFVPWFSTSITRFGPVVEVGKSKFTFIDQSPIELLVSGKVQDVPWITTSVSEEGLAPAALFIANATALKELNDEWNEIAPHLLDFNFTIPEVNRSSIAQKIREHYFGANQIADSTVKQLVRMVGDRLYNSEVEKVAKLQATAVESPVRFGFFSYRGNHSASEVFTGTTTNYGVMHLDDLAYVLKSYFDPTTTERDQKMQEVMINLWVSYAAEGVPDMGIDWPGLDTDKDGLQYLHIAGPDNIFMNKSLNYGNKDFWQSIPLLENMISLKNETEVTED